MFRRTEGRTRSPGIFDTMAGSGRHSLFSQPVGTPTYRPRARRALPRGISGGYLPKHLAPPPEYAHTTKRPSFGIKVPKPDREAR